MKFRHTTLILPAIVILLFAGCKKDEEGTLKVTFKGSFGSDPLAMLDIHDYMSGQRIQFTRSEFFISDLNLIDGSGNAYPLRDIELVDLSFTNSTQAENGYVLTFGGIPAATYSSMEFGFGVASDINATLPGDYPSSSPLSNTARYWSPWQSFIFSRTEGFLDTLVNGLDDPDLGFAYHTGTDGLYRDLRVNTPISITDGGTLSIVFNLDHQKLMGLPASPIDIKAKPQNHNPQDTVQVQAIVNNWTSALTYYIE